MKKLLLLTIMALWTIGVNAQMYGAYSMHHTSDMSVLNTYIGEKVVVKKPNRDKALSDGYDAFIFDVIMNGELDAVYTISKIGITKKQIILNLVGVNGHRVKAKVNIGKQRDNNGMQSLESFFLVGKYEADVQRMIQQMKGQTVYNSDNAPVAIVKNVFVKEGHNDKPLIYWDVLSGLDGESFIATVDDAKTLCLNLGRVLSNNLVKRKYKIIGVHFPSSDYPQELKQAKYHIQVVGNPDEMYFCNIESPEIDAFTEDLSRHYVACLTSVEKSSDLEEQSGTITVVEDNNLIRYQYADNVIDIIIFGDSQGFYFLLQNVSDNSIKVIWDDAVFVDCNGLTSKIIHSGVKYANMNASQPATTIIKGAALGDMIIPVVNVSYDEQLKDWIVDSMYLSSPGKEPGQFKLMLPVQEKEIINEYIFIFETNFVYKHPERLNL